MPAMTMCVASSIRDGRCRRKDALTMPLRVLHAFWTWNRISSRHLTQEAPVIISKENTPKPSVRHVADVWRAREWGVADDYTVALEKDVWQRRQRIYTCASQGGPRSQLCSSRCPEQHMAIREVTSTTTTTTPSPNVTRADVDASSLEASDGQQRTSRKEPPQDAMRDGRLPETTMTPALSCRIPDGEDHVWQEIEETTLRLIRQPTDVFTRCRRADLFSQVRHTPSP